MARSTIRVTNDQGFGGYYGNLRKWEGVKARDLSWREELGAPEAAQDPDWWIDETTTRGEYNARTRAHAAKWRDDWA